MNKNMIQESMLKARDEYIETINVENNKYIVNQKDGIYEISKI